MKGDKLRDAAAIDRRCRRRALSVYCQVQNTLTYATHPRHPPTLFPAAAAATPNIFARPKQ